MILLEELHLSDYLRVAWFVLSHNRSDTHGCRVKTAAALKVFYSDKQLLSCFMTLNIWQVEVEWALLQSPLKLSWSHLFKLFHFRHSQRAEDSWGTVLLRRGYVTLWQMGAMIERTCSYSCYNKQREGRAGWEKNDWLKHWSNLQNITRPWLHHSCGETVRIFH